MRVVRQSLGTECGLACLAMVLSHHRVDVELAELRDQSAPSASGTRVRQLVDLSGRYGLTGRAVRLDLGQLSDLRAPAILHWSFNHFVVFQQLTRNGAIIVDPANGRQRVGLQELSDNFTGVAIEFRASSALSPQRRLLKASLTDFWSSQHGLVLTAAGIVALSVTLQLLTMIAPLALAGLIDEAVRLHSPRLGATLAAMMIGVALFVFAGDTLRRFSLANLGISLNAQINLNLVRHLLSLDFPFFVSRRLNDLLSRIESTRAIRDSLTDEALPVVVDGMFAIFTAAIVFLLAPIAGLVMLGSAGAYLAVKVFTFSAARERTQRTLSALASERASITDTLRGVATVKLLNGEPSRLSAWCGANLRALEATQRQREMTAALVATRSAVTAIDLALVALAAVLLVMNRGLTLGGLTALLIYRQQFQERALTLIDRAFELRLLGVHFERLSDIVTAQPAAPVSERGPEGFPISRGELVCRDLWYRHEGDPHWLLKGLDFEARGGEFLAICGRSGGGKTTLLRLLTGLLQPGQGEIKIDGHLLTPHNVAAFRDCVGAVLQDDQLFTGTILENISCWDVPADEERVIDCATAACIHDHISGLPMGYHTLLGDMGSTLSAGQRQRLFIARALYKRPRLLFLDEGTANLDAELEIRVLENLRSLDLTIVCVAHRPGAIALADRVLALADGSLQPVETAARPTVAAE